MTIDLTGAPRPLPAADPRLTGTSISATLLDIVGRTPLVHLARLAEREGISPLLAVKLERANPTGSGKDRSAAAMLRSALTAGLVRAGGVVVEPASGNTGAALAMAAAQLGLHCVLVVSEDVSPERLDLLRALGAELVACPAGVAADDPRGVTATAERISRERGAFRPDPAGNPANPAAHEQGTGREIWEQTAGRVTHVVAVVGSGGTLSGVGRALKTRSPGVRVIAASPEGSRPAAGSGRPNLIGGPGEDLDRSWSAPRPRTPGVAGMRRSRVGAPPSWDPDVVDEVVQVSDAESFAVARSVSRVEGLLLGASGGLAMAAALRVARGLGPDELVVVVDPDSGRADVGRVHDDEWLASRGFLEQAERTVGSVLDMRARLEPCLPELLHVGPDESVRSAIDLMRSTAVSQLPVCRGEAPFALAEVVGSVDELVLMGHVVSSPRVLDLTVGNVMGPPLPTVGAGQSLERAIELLGRHPALLVLSGGRPRGVLTRTDILEVMGLGVA